MPDKPTPTDAELKAMWQIHAADIGGIFHYARAVLAKWGAPHGQAPAKPDPAYSAACNLATALFKKHFAHLPDFASGQAVWSLCDSTAGVISQIDNMVSGLVQPPATSPQADSVQEDAARYRWLREGNDAKHGAAWYVAVNLYGCEWDAAIDAARATQKEEE